MRSWCYCSLCASVSCSCTGLAVLAAVILMGAGIAKVLEDQSVEKQFTPQQGV